MSAIGLGIGIPFAMGNGMRGTLALAPVNTGAPTVTGTPAPDEVLSCSNGTWLFSPTSYAFQWYANGVAVDGETANTFTIPNDAAPGTSYTCGVIASNDVGDSPEVLSNAKVLPTPAVFKASFTTVSQFADEGTAGLTLEPQGDATIGTSKFAQGALELDGSASQFVDGGSTSALAISGPFTIKWSADLDADSNGYAAILVTATDGSITDGFLIEQGQRGTFFLAQGGLILQHADDPRGTGPHDYVVTRDAESNVTFYIDGEEVATGSSSAPLTCSVVHIGGDGFVAVETIKGAIGGIEVYDSVQAP